MGTISRRRGASLRVSWFAKGRSQGQGHRQGQGLVVPILVEWRTHQPTPPCRKPPGIDPFSPSKLDQSRLAPRGITNTLRQTHFQNQRRSLAEEIPSRSLINAAISRRTSVACDDIRNQRKISVGHFNSSGLSGSKTVVMHGGIYFNPSRKVEVEMNVFFL